MPVDAARMRVAACLLAAFCLFFASTARAEDVRRAPLLDVPYVPQRGALCGGAALAMVLRYWGVAGVVAEDFASFTDPQGMRVDSLMSAARSRRFLTVAVDSSAVNAQLALGRPIIALLRLGSDRYHYVVLLERGPRGVLYHDPNVAPFRARDAATFDRQWAAASHVALLVVPAADSLAEASTPNASPPDAAESDAAREVPCDSLIAAAVAAAHDDDSKRAEELLLRARSLCPDASAPSRELAGVRFLGGDYAGAAGWARESLAMDPNDAESWRLLATSLFLLRDEEGALAAWNHLHEPTLDLADIKGLDRTRYRAVSDQLHFAPGRVLTPGAYRRAQRRLIEVPAQEGSRMSLRPLPGGRVRVDVALLERPSIFEGRWNAALAGLHALAQQEAEISTASPTGNGELWSVGGRWAKRRPRVSMMLAMPAAGGRPGIWSVASFWERQTYAPCDGDGIVEERRRASLSFSDWIGADLGLSVSSALDSWKGKGKFLGLESRLESRRAQDHLAISLGIAPWISFGSPQRFGVVDATATWLDPQPQSSRWSADAGITHATSAAPHALWEGAGTGIGRAPLLRAHPLLNEGVLDGAVFGRSLAHLSIERQMRIARAGPVTFAFALFGDAAKAWNPNLVPTQIDIGTGFRIRAMGSEVCIDGAHGTVDGSWALSLRWQTAAQGLSRAALRE